MAVKPCHQNRAIFLDPVLRKGRENMQGWYHAFTTIPPAIHKRIRASVSDEVSGIIKLGTTQGWIVQLCHFYLISRLQNCRGRRNRRLQGRPLREHFINMSAKLSSCPTVPDCKPCSKN
jgi:hypothetical protein